MKWSFLQWLVKMMDEYRDIRLLWTVVESILMVLIVVLVFYFIYQVKLVERCLRERFKKLDERIKKISELHKRADELEEEQDEMLANIIIMSMLNYFHDLEPKEIVDIFFKILHNCVKEIEAKGFESFLYKFKELGIDNIEEIKRIMSGFKLLLVRLITVVLIVFSIYFVSKESVSKTKFDSVNIKSLN
jgi:hypothetical protein